MELPAYGGQEMNRGLEVPRYFIKGEAKKMQHVFCLISQENQSQIRVNRTNRVLFLHRISIAQHWDCLALALFDIRMA